MKRIFCAIIVAGALVGCGKRPDIVPEQHYGHFLSQASKEHAWSCIDKSVARQLDGTANYRMSLEDIKGVCWKRAAEIDKLKIYQQSRQAPNLSVIQ